MKWSTRRVDEIGSCKNGMNFSSQDSGVQIRCLGVGDFKDFAVIDNPETLSYISLNALPSEEYMLHDEDIVFVRSNGNKDLVGRCVSIYTQGMPVTYSGFCIRFRKNREGLDTAYLLYYFKNSEIRKQMSGRGANIKNLNQKIIGDLKVPIPPISLQREFASFVEQSDKSKFVSFKSQFIEMFGDPVENPMRWSVCYLGDCLETIENGKSLNCETFARTGNLPAVLKLSAVTYGEYNPFENKQLPSADMFISKVEVKKGDLLFSRKNTYEYVGMTAVVKDTPSGLMLPDLIFRLVTKPECHRVYLSQLINHPLFRPLIRDLASGSTGSMPNISKQRLSALRIPLPPEEVQAAFEVIVEQTDKSKFELKEAIKKLEKAQAKFVSENC
jgi:type I restriction enzyme S subunit